MDFLEEIEGLIHSITRGDKPSKESQQILSDFYRSSQPSHVLFKQKQGLSTYLETRFRPIYKTVSKVLSILQERCALPPIREILDLGAGPGTASFAALDLFPELEKLTLVETSRVAIDVGKSIEANLPMDAELIWEEENLTNIKEKKADLAIASYVLGELKEPMKLVEQVLNSDVSIFVIIEPGTLKGFETIRSIRDRFNDLVLAPCPSRAKCPMKGSDWCHFSVRVERSRMHRHLKDASLGYEDEKFSYLILSSYLV